MSQFIRVHGVTIVALGTGLAIGVTATVYLYKLSTDISRELGQLAAKLERLRREVEELKVTVDSKQNRRKRQTQTGYYSVHASSGEDDEDIFEEATSG